MARTYDTALSHRVENRDIHLLQNFQFHLVRKFVSACGLNLSHVIARYEPPPPNFNNVFNSLILSVLLIQVSIWALSFD